LADRQQLRQVLLNLLTNAGDAMHKGGRLTLRVRRAELAGARPAVVIEVSDSGVGIPPEHLTRVTDPFFTTKEEGKGTGLGLAICKRIVLEHRGTFEIDSVVNQGTTVRITLPVTNATNVNGLRGHSRE
jgi:signal transduction histidine kinase